MGHLKNGTYLDFPSQEYTGQSEGLPPMAIYGIVMGVIGLVFLIAAIYTLVERRKRIREKKSVMALVGSVRRPNVVATTGTLPPAPPPEMNEAEGSAKESGGEEEEEEEDEDARFRSGEEKLQFVMQRWMRIMQEKQAQRRQREEGAETKEAVPVAVKRWRGVLDLIHTEQAKNPRLAVKGKEEQAAEPPSKRSVHFETPVPEGQAEAPDSVVTVL